MDPLGQKYKEINQFVNDVNKYIAMAIENRKVIKNISVNVEIDAPELSDIHQT